MPRKDLFGNENPDTLEFIRNMVKENSEDLSAVLNEIRKVADRLEDVCELTTFKRIEDKMNNLQNNVNELMNKSSDSPQEAQTPAPPAEENIHQHNSTETPYAKPPPITLKCTSWEDFQAFASKAQIVSFTYRESDKVFEADALKNNQIVAYIGEVPKIALLLKLWLSGRLEIPEGKVFEGVLSKA